MRFRLAEPSRLLVDREVDSLQAEDAEGRFGILPGHERFLTALEPSILIWRFHPGDTDEPREQYAAVRRGILRVEAGGVEVAVRSAKVSDDLAGLEAVVRQAREQRGVHHRRNLRSLYKMQISAWRRLMEYEHDTG